MDHYIYEYRKLKADNQHYVVSQICANPYTRFILALSTRWLLFQWASTIMVQLSVFF
jgi:hypothetical protein